jgi:tetrahydromethanopterin S-methyltransferase subunit G
MADRGVDPLSLIQVEIEKLDSKLDKTNDKVDVLTEIVSKQALLFERLANFEITSKESTNRIHERIDKHNKRIEQVEHYMMTDGCPAHKSFVTSINYQLDKYNNIIQTTDSKLNQLAEEVKYLKNAPTRALGKIGASILAVFGAGIGGWLLLKFGLEIPK